jgi:hypothetical protein
MSLLVRQDYANPDKPLWLGTTGGTISGALTVDGTLDVTGTATFEADVNAPIFGLTDASGGLVGAIDHIAVSEGDTADGLVFQGDEMRFGKTGTANANTTFTPSTFGANLDNFTIGGALYATIGVVPDQIITAAKTVNPVPASPAAPGQFGVDNTITGLTNAEYDVQMTGTVYLVSGAPDPNDYVVYTFTSGGGLGSISAIVFPGATNVMGGNGVSGIGPLTVGGPTAGIEIRARLSPNSSGTTMGASVRAFPQGGSTAVYGAGLSLLDVQRVR